MTEPHRGFFIFSFQPQYMMTMKVKLLILQIMLVAGTGGRLVQNKMREVLASDFRVVLTALQRSNPQEVRLPPGTLDTEQTVIDFLFDRRNADEIKEMMGEVDTLDLGGMSLKRLPVHGIQQLSSLRSLILDDNERLSILKGDIEMISQLPIKEVSIRNSNLSFETFKALQGLRKLCRLDISGNKLVSTDTGDDKFGDLTSRLIELRAADCDLNSDWLNSILKCTGLESLDVSFCQSLFKDRVPTDDYSLMKGLTSLNIQASGINNSWLDDILRCTNLKSLNISFCQDLFKGKTPSDDCSLMRGLTSLNVSWCSLKSAWLDEVLKCTNLIDLDVSCNTNVCGDHNNLKNFKNLRSLRKLDASCCNLTTAGLNEICRCGGLEELSVRYNTRLWTGKADIGTCRKSLRVLNATSTGLDETVLRALCGVTKRDHCETSTDEKMQREGGFSKLAILDISWNRSLGRVISQEGLSFGCLEKTLVELRISDCDLTSSRLFKAISKCERLARLDASWNSDLWRDADEINFGYLKAGLRELSIRSTGLPPAVLQKILELDRLEMLDIGGNRTVCRALGDNCQVLGGVRDTLKDIKVRDTGLTGKGLRWIFNEFRGLRKVDASSNWAIGPEDLMGLDFDTLGDRLFEFSVTADLETLAKLRRRLPLAKT